MLASRMPIAALTTASGWVRGLLLRLRTLVGEQKATCLALLLVLAGWGGALAQPAPDPLPSWSDGAAKQAIVDFVGRVTREGGPDYVASPERIATFDNDGTLWVEQPNYVQGYFLIDRVRAVGAKDAELLERQPFAAVADDGEAALTGLDEHALAALVASTHSGMTVDAFETIAKDWIAAAKHPALNRRFVDLVYQPQLELLAYLRENDFKTYIVSGGGIEFMRSFADDVYGVPPEQVIGSSGRTQFELRGDTAVLEKIPGISAPDDGPGKPVNINLHIGRRPILAFGNSDGDLPMLQYTATASSSHPRLMLLVHHDDAEREFAYDRDAKVGRLDKALDAAIAEKWIVVSMKDDWRRIFPEPGSQ